MKTHSLSSVAAWWPVLLFYLLSYGLFVVVWLLVVGIESTYSGPVFSSALLIMWSSTLEVWPRRWWLLVGGLLITLGFHMPPMITMCALMVAGEAFSSPWFSRVPERIRLSIVASLVWWLWAVVQWPITSLAGVFSVLSLLLLIWTAPWLPRAARGVQYFSFNPRKLRVTEELP